MPVMSHLMKVPVKIAVGSSLGVVVLSSTVGAARLWFRRSIELSDGGADCIGVCNGELFGATATKKVGGARLKILFACLVLAAAISTVLKYFGQSMVSVTFLTFAGLSLCVIAVKSAWFSASSR